GRHADPRSPPAPAEREGARDDDAARGRSARHHVVRHAAAANGDRGDRHGARDPARHERGSPRRQRDGRTTFMMKTLAAAVVGGAFIGAVALLPAAGASESETRATAAALSWLALIDSGRYADSWREASANFRRAITEKGWENSL